MKNFRLKSTSNIVFPEETSSIIESLAIKYGLETLKELFEKFIPKTLQEKEEFRERFENLSGTQIAKTIKEIVQGKIRDEDTFIAVLQERLNIPGKTAKELAKDLEEKILSLVQITLKEEKEVSPYKGAKETISPEKPAPPKRKDTYREPIE
ncbi:MAG: hypothetical protein Q8N73_02890 [bacterium]|nr:hypothetical protein [bacterium]